MTEQAARPASHEVREQRYELLDHIQSLLDKPMLLLSFAWLVLMIVDYTIGLDHILSVIRYIIWGLFVADFALEFAVAPHKLEYLRAHWLVALALALPAFRVIRVFRIFSIIAAHGAGGMNLLRILATMNRGLTATRSVLGHRGVGRVFGITMVVVLAGAAGMLSFESPRALAAAGYAQQVQGGAGLHGYGDALWWTGMLLTTIGSAYWPISSEGRVLCFLLSVYSISVFGYITASIASYFVGKDVPAAGQQPSGVASDPNQLQEEIRALRQQITVLTQKLEAAAEGS